MKVLRLSVFTIVSKKNLEFEDICDNLSNLWAKNISLSRCALLRFPDLVFGEFAVFFEARFLAGNLSANRFGFVHFTFG